MSYGGYASCPAVTGESLEARWIHLYVTWPGVQCFLPVGLSSSCLAPDMLGDAA